LGFVPQDDIIHPHLTVFENILHSARIRLGGALNDKTIQKHVDAVIDGLGLSKVKYSVVGSEQRRIISGGERKRVSIALELVAAPQVLILDEPTSGLDAQAALSIMESLRLFSRQGLTVICVIHQPRVEIFDALDNLLVLELGKSVYSGKASEAKQHFQALGYVFKPNLNPADLILDIVSGKLHPADAGEVDSKKQELPYFGTDMKEPVSSGRHDESNTNMSLLQELETKYSKRIAAWHRQIYLCLFRDLIQQSRQIAMFVTEIMGGILTGLLIGLAMYEFHGQIFQGMFLPPFEVLSSAINYTLVTQLGLLGCLAISMSLTPVISALANGNCLS
jgi:ABC-type multidrug transport system ATPase subunit